MFKILASSNSISAATIGLAFAVAVAIAAPLNASAADTVATARAGIVADRIDDAFALLRMTNIDPAGRTVVPRPVRGDFLHTSDCASATWPNIDASCLLAADGSPAPRVRNVTVGNQIGANTTVLLRIPAPEMARR